MNVASVPASAKRARIRGHNYLPVAQSTCGSCDAKPDNSSPRRTNANPNWKTGTPIASGRCANSARFGRFDRQQRRMAQIFAGTGNNIVTLDSDTVQGWLQVSAAGPVFAALTGASATVNLGMNMPGNTLIFDKAMHITGGMPAATVNVANANVTFDGRLLLKNAARVDI